MPENKDNFVLELKPCDRCGNAFMVKKGQIKPEQELICDNCIKLEERKKTLMLGVFDKVIEVENKMEDSINEMKSQLNVAKGKFNKQFFLEQIKRRADTLKKSIELVEKIEQTNDEKFIEEYVNLFEKIKKENFD
ncbi:MAG: hypothetical protein EU535_03400 [Promethearchaeota archaeon]|nr:MAG: hypothetical protein EU535_03400 [Candidatus Lokiarchaeota archaeon]